MRVVGGPHQIGDADQFARDDSDPVILEGGVDLAAEIVAWRVRDGPVALQETVTVVGVVGALQQMRYPSDVVLDRYDLEFGKALQDPAQDQVHERLFDTMMHRYVVLHDADFFGVRGGRAAPFRHHVQADRHAGLLSHRPKAVVNRIVVGRFGRRLTPNHRALKPFGGDPGELLGPHHGVVKRDGRDSGQAVRIVGAVLGQPVVVGAEARLAQLAVFELEQPHPETGVDYFGGHAVALLVLDSFHRVPSPRPHVSVTLTHLVLEFPGVHAGYREGRDRQPLHPLGHEVIPRVAVEFFHHVRRPVRKTVLDARRPDVWWFDNVGVCRYYSLLRHDRFPWVKLLRF